ncbi:MAG: caspase family protein [Planctomycetes bacterium]|nr:caspase family protein [Planctomycetota bacterium]
MRASLRSLIACSVVALLCAPGCFSDLTRVPLEEREELPRVTGSPLPWNYRLAVAPLIVDVDPSANREGSESDAWLFTPEPAGFVEAVGRTLAEQGAFSAVAPVEVAYTNPRDRDAARENARRAAPPEHYDLVMVPRLLDYRVEYVERGFLWTTVTWCVSPLWGWYYAGETYRMRATVHYELLSVHSGKPVYDGEVESSVTRAVSEMDRGMWIFWFWSLPGNLKAENWSVLRDALEPMLLDEIRLDALRFAKERLAEVFAPPPESAGLPDAPPAAEAATRVRRALVIGVDRYADAAIPAGGAQQAAADADRVAAWLQTRDGGGLTPEKIKVLTGPQATRANVAEALAGVAARAQPPDVVVVYFAGNGAVDKEGACYLLCHDAAPGDLAATALPLSWLAERLDALQARHVVVALDAAFDDPQGARCLAAGGERSAAGAEAVAGALRLLAGSRRAVLAAASPGQGALEHPGLGGLFSYFLISGHTRTGGDDHQRADRDRDGVVTLAEAFEFCRDRTRDQALLTAVDQRPALYGEARALRSFNAWPAEPR